MGSGLGDDGRDLGSNGDHLDLGWWAKYWGDGNGRDVRESRDTISSLKNLGKPFLTKYDDYRPLDIDSLVAMPSPGRQLVIYICIMQSYHIPHYL